jgi:hypothetical protein
VGGKHRDRAMMLILFVWTSGGKDLPEGPKGLKWDQGNNKE